MKKESTTTTTTIVWDTLTPPLPLSLLLEFTSERYFREYYCCCYCCCFRQRHNFSGYYSLSATEMARAKATHTHKVSLLLSFLATFKTSLKTAQVENLAAETQSHTQLVQLFFPFLFYLFFVSNHFCVFWLPYAFLRCSWQSIIAEIFVFFVTIKKK